MCNSIPFKGINLDLLKLHILYKRSLVYLNFNENKKNIYIYINGTLMYVHKLKGETFQQYQFSMNQFIRNIFFQLGPFQMNSHLKYDYRKTAKQNK